MNLFVTFTLAETDTGPFNLFSNADGYTSAIAAYVPKASLLAGYTIMNAPNGTTIVRAYSTGSCFNYIDMGVNVITTTTSTTLTTTTTIFVPCIETLITGGPGIDETLVPLSPVGGMIVFEFNAGTNPDKLEIIHNNIKKATSGMTVANSGPFDNVYGTPPLNTIPDLAMSIATDQFIGSASGVIPVRDFAFYVDTGFAVSITAGYQQLIWWEYTPADYLINSNVLIRVTGSSLGNSWSAHRLCTFSIP